MTNAEPTASRGSSKLDQRQGHVGSVLRTCLHVGTRLGWGLLDQSISSLTNFALGVVVARNVSPRDFGAYGIAFSVYIVALGLSRAMVSEPLTVRFSTAAEGRWKQGVRAATGVSLCLGAALGLACLACVVIVSDPVMAAVLRVLGFLLPGLLVQDTWRFAFFSSRRGAAACANDMTWAVVLAGTLTFIFVTGRTSVGWFVFAWGASASAAALFGVFQARLVPAPTRTFSWLREQRDLIPRFVGEFGVTTLAAQASIFAIGAVAGLTAVGAIRAGQLLFGPLNVIYMGAGIAVLPEAVRVLRSSTEALRRACVLFSAALAASALAVGVLASVLPDRIGTALLGDSWGPARTVILPISVWMAAFGISLGGGIGLRALAAARLSFRARTIVAPIGIVLSLGGAALAGARGGAWGFASGAAVGSIIWWRFFRRGLREHRPTAEPFDDFDEPEATPFPGGA